MPRKRQSPLEDYPPPASSSSEEEEEEEEEETSASLLSPSHKKYSVKKPARNPKDASSPRAKPHSTSGGEEEENESSDSDSGSDSKPLNDSSEPNKSSKTNFKLVSAGKRSIHSNRGEVDTKRKKKKKILDADEEKDLSDEKSDPPKTLKLQRLFSEEDEIVILKGIPEYYSKTGIDPLTNIPGLHKFIKKSLHVNVSSLQLSSKIKHLKTKHYNKVKKRKDGKDPVISIPHEIKCYELSKKVWGDDMNDVFSAKATANRKVRNVRLFSKFKHLLCPDNEVNEFLCSCLCKSFLFNDMNFPYPGLWETTVKEGLDLLGRSKAKELEKKWRKSQMAELEVYLDRADLVSEQMKLILEALKSRNS